MGLPSLELFSSATRQQLWAGDALGTAGAPVLASGHAALDAQLPGGGWPVGALVELLQAAPQALVWPLLLPVLTQAVAARGGPVVLVGAPYEPFGPALAAAGLPAQALLCIGAAAARDGGGGGAGGDIQRLWACEQALRCAEVAAVLAWLPRARVGDLRRLQLAAARHQALLFVLRPDSVADTASPAQLRLRVASAANEAGQIDIHLLKRRGPPLAAPLTLPARSQRMAALLAASQWRRKRRLQEEGAALESAAVVVRIDARRAGAHALDRAAVAA